MTGSSLGKTFHKNAKNSYLKNSGVGIFQKFYPGWGMPTPSREYQKDLDDALDGLIGSVAAIIHRPSLYVFRNGLHAHFMSHAGHMLIM